MKRIEFNISTGERIEIEMSPAEIAAIPAVSSQEKNRAVDQERQMAYSSEADPLYFKWKRGEATEQDWLNKISEIKQRFPRVV